MRSEEEIREEIARIQTGWLQDTSRARAYVMGLKFALGEDMPSLMMRAWDALLGAAHGLMKKLDESS